MCLTPGSSFGLELNKLEVATAAIEEQPVMVEIDDVPDLVSEDVDEGPGVFHPIQTGNALVTDTPPHLTWYGGPVISSVAVWTIFWGANVPDQAYLNSFYQNIPNSPYFDWLGEYNTPNQQIGRGRLGGSVRINNPPPADVSNDDIINALAALINAGQLPMSNGNNLYMVHFPPGVTVSLGSDRSCDAFCAYHYTFTFRGVAVPYGVMPDQNSGACAGRCGSDPNPANNTTVTSSHELVESVTDPDAGLAQTIGPPLGWYDRVNGEIGDICQPQAGVLNGFAVQKQWSNRFNMCIITAPGSGTDPERHWVTAVYGDLLHRNPSSAELDNWIRVLHSQGRYAVAAGIIGSRESHGVILNALYQRYLHRPVDPAGYATFIGFLDGGGREEDLANVLLSSEEYFNQAGRNNYIFVANLYRDVLQRVGSPAEINYWLQLLSRGASRATIANGFTSSQEYRSDLVAAWYVYYLHRAADANGLRYFVGQLNSGYHDQTVQAELIATDEYFHNR